MNTITKNKLLETIILIFLIGFVVYLPSFFGQFIWDDEDFVYQNQYVKEFRADKFFTANIEEGRGKITNYYRPIQLLVYSTTHAVFGFNPHAYHAVSILLHLIASCMIFLFFWRMTKNYFLSFIAALIFLIHPVQTEVVSYISGISDSLYVIFGMLSLILFLEKDKQHYYVLSIGSFIICLLSKETGLVFLGLILLLWLLNLKDTRRMSSVIPYGLITTAYLWFHFTVINQQNITASYGNTAYAHSIIVRLLTFIQNIYTYIAILIFPKELFMERDYSIQPLTHIFDWHVVVFVLLICLISWGIYSKRQHIKNKKIVIFCLLAFFISFVPYTGIVLINGIFYEHFLYLPLVFFFGFIFYLFDWHPKKLIVAIFVVWFGLLTIRSYVRQYQWIDPIRFYQQTLEHTPRSLRVHNNLGIAYADKGELNNSIEQYNEALKLDPTIPNIYHNLANVYLAQGNAKKAEQYYIKAIQADPNFYFSYIALIRLYQITGEKEKLQMWTIKTKQKFPNLLQ